MKIKLIYNFNEMCKIQSHMIFKIIIIFNSIINISYQECQCGKIEVNIRQKRINMGNVVPPGKFPWQMYLQIHYFEHSGALGEKIFSGVLLSSKHVLTSAKCLEIFFQK